jgi:radical SAM superfamily enzyme YgiQ (UPF0313 family)
MKILLVRPPHHNPALAFGYQNEPLSLEAVAAALHDCDVELVDLRHETEPLPAILARVRPDVVGTGGVTADVASLQRILRQAKELDPGILTIVGGHHASIAPQDFNLPFVDAIAIGMGEDALRELVLAHGARGDVRAVKGLAFPGPQGLAFSEARPLPESLDALPLPRRELAHRYRRHYRAFGHPVALINSSRGCPFHCRFCSIVRETGGKYLTKSAERVLEELATIPQKLVRFADGNSFGNPRRMERLAELVGRAGLGQRYIFDVRSDTIARQPALFEKWRAAGLAYACVGFESVSERRLDAMNKQASLADHKEAIRILHQNDIAIIGQFMIDPDYEERDFRELYEFVLTQNIQVPSYTLTTPFPGTALAEERREEILGFAPEEYDCFHPLLKTKLDRSLFLEQFLGLYRRSYGAKRLATGLAERLRRTAPGRPLPLLDALAAWIVLGWVEKRVRRELGIEPGRATHVE